jgi:hypothetical protein
MLAKQAVQEESRLKIRTSWTVFDESCADAKIESLAALLWNCQQSHQPATQIRRLTDVWLSLSVFTPQQEDRGVGGYRSENFDVPLGLEWQANTEHLLILKSFGRRSTKHTELMQGTTTLVKVECCQSRERAHR